MDVHRVNLCCVFLMNLPPIELIDKVKVIANSKVKYWVNADDFWFVSALFCAQLNGFTAKIGCQMRGTSDRPWLRRIHGTVCPRSSKSRCAIATHRHLATSLLCRRVDWVCRIGCSTICDTIIGYGIQQSIVYTFFDTVPYKSIFNKSHFNNLRSSSKRTRCCCATLPSISAQSPRWPTNLPKRCSTSKSASQTRCPRIGKVSSWHLATFRNWHRCCPSLRRLRRRFRTQNWMIRRLFGSKM